MKRTLLLMVILAFVIGIAAVEKADASGSWYPAFWGPDLRIQWVQTTVWVSVRTGYWGGWYPWSFGGFSWPAYTGWGSAYTGPYAGYGWYGWWGPSWFYGFVDYFYYRITITWPRPVIAWSRYWDPEGVGYTMDFFTEEAPDGRAQPFGLGPNGQRIDEVVEIGEHYWSVSGGVQEGVFTPLEWVVAHPGEIAAYLQQQGFDQPTIDDILDDQIVMDAIAGNDTGNKLIGIQWCSYDLSIPCNPGDANGDGFVSLDDFVILKNNFGATTGMTCSTGDFDGDGDVDLDDFVLLKNNFGMVP